MPILNMTKTYRSVGRCIYCGSDEPPLSDEHIIPFGIGGRLLLPNASCETCRNATSKTETKFQNLMIGPFRSSMRFPKRNGKGKPRRGRLELTLGTPEKPLGKKLIPASEWPHILPLPLLPAPSLLFGPWRQSPKISLVCHTDKLDPLRAKYGPARSPEYRWDIPTFAAVLAKIAHSFAFAEAGGDELSTFDLFLPRIIIDGARAIPTDFVGGTMKPLANVNTLHQLALWTGLSEKAQKQYLAVGVRLFSYMPSPAYQVIVGERPFTSSWVGQPVLVP